MFWISWVAMFKIFATALLFFISFSLIAKEQKLVACIDDHPPYQYLGETPYGSHISALHKLAQILNKKLTFIQSPNFARCVALLESGYVDVVAGLNVTKARQKFAFYAPFKSADSLAVITKGAIKIKEYDDFKGKIIGVPRGATYFPKFDNDKSLNKVSIQSSRVGLSLLAKERIDLLITNSEMLNLHTKDIEKSDLIISSIILDEYRTKETNFGFSRKHSLNLTEEEIILAVKTAFERGDFRLPVKNNKVIH